MDTSKAIAIPHAPLATSISATSFRAGVSSSLCQIIANNKYVNWICELSSPTSPDKQMSNAANDLITNAPRLPNMLRAMRPPSVSASQRCEIILIYVLIKEYVVLTS